ncbi:hypothetical protein LJC11_03955 [Bacteroidales bacterium OttesenSCG-928-I21]|nr:hypothetical protein [Bacteroidales bacterium OttesenSCG-928-I21]
MFYTKKIIVYLVLWFIAFAIDIFHFKKYGIDKNTIKRFKYSWKREPKKGKIDISTFNDLHISTIISNVLYMYVFIEIMQPIIDMLMEDNTVILIIGSALIVFFMLVFIWLIKYLILFVFTVFNIKSGQH